MASASAFARESNPAPVATGCSSVCGSVAGSMVVVVEVGASVVVSAARVCAEVPEPDDPPHAARTEPVTSAVSAARREMREGEDIRLPW